MFSNSVSMWKTTSRHVPLHVLWSPRHSWSSHKVNQTEGSFEKMVVNCDLLSIQLQNTLSSSSHQNFLPNKFVRSEDLSKYMCECEAVKSVCGARCGGTWGVRCGWCMSRLITRYFFTPLSATANRLELSALNLSHESVLCDNRSDLPEKGTSLAKPHTDQRRFAQKFRDTMSAAISLSLFCFIWSRLTKLSVLFVPRQRYQKRSCTTCLSASTRQIKLWTFQSLKGVKEPLTQRYCENATLCFVLHRWTKRQRLWPFWDLR